MLVFEDPALTAKQYFGSSQEKQLEDTAVRNCIEKRLSQLKFLTSEKALLQPQAVQFSLFSPACKGVLFFLLLVKVFYF